MFDRKEKVIVLGMHPITFFGMTIQKMLRKITFVFWICDYFPGNKTEILLFEKLKKHYHDRIPFSCYLSDGINRVFNNSKVVKSLARKTVMWGVKPKNIKRKNNKKFTILFIGLIKDSQGIEFVLEFLKNNKDYFVNILGLCDDVLFKKYKKIINDNKISKNVYFPNKFVSEKEIIEISRSCNVGIALYNADKTNPTYYTDPGKVKAYAEMGLPVIMTKVSGIAPYVEKFNAGILVSRNQNSLGDAILKMKKNYKKYKTGINNFNKYFYFESYYEDKFKFLESI